MKQQADRAYREASRSGRFFWNIEHLTDPDFNAKAPRYKTARIVGTDRIVALAQFVPASVTYGHRAFFRVRDPSGSLWSIHASELDSFTL